MTDPAPPPDDGIPDPLDALREVVDGVTARPPSLDDLLGELHPLDAEARRGRIETVVHQLARHHESEGTRQRYRDAVTSRRDPETDRPWISRGDWGAMMRAADREVRAVDKIAARATDGAARATVTRSPGEHPYSVDGGRLVVTRDDGSREVVADFVAQVVGDVERDDGAERTRAFRVRVTLPDGSSGEADVTSAQLGDPVRWAADAAGARASIRAVPAAAQHVRAAAQLLAPADLARSTIFVHTGWTRRVDGLWRYLSAPGALGADGMDASALVQLPGSLGSYSLPDPTEATLAALREAIRASLAVLDVAPDAVTVPVLAATHRATLPIPPDGSVWTSGPTGVGKSQVAALAQQHYGAPMDGQHLPAAWGSTGNALADQAFRVANALLTIDDFVPGGSAQDMAKLRRTAEQVLRASANGAGRDRLDATATLRTGRPPRAQILATGEDLPPGQSLRGRLFIAELAADGMRWDRLSDRQAEAAAGVYALATAGYVRWLARQLDDEELTPDLLTARRIELRVRATGSGQHRRTPDMIASLALGWEQWLRYAADVGAITEDERARYAARIWRALIAGADTQAEAQVAMSPAQVYCAALVSAVSSGRAYLAAMDGGAPKDPVGWGWETSVVEYQSVYPGGDLDRKSSHRPRPGAVRIGWVEGTAVYLDPDAAYEVVVRHVTTVGLPTLPTKQTTHRRLDEAKLLASVDTGDPGKRRLTVRQTVDGRRRTRVLHLADSVFGEAES